MSALALRHFQQAASEIGAHGDNDTLPFDIDNRFIKEKSAEISAIAFEFSQRLAREGQRSARSTVAGLHLFSERLLAVSGPSGFRITTKIHPFWNFYLNGLGVAIAEALEPKRSPRVHSYRYISSPDQLFDRSSSWRAFREAAANEASKLGTDSVVVQTDISGFYEHVSHHRLENLVDDLFPDDLTVAPQIDRLLSKLSAGRSFGLPIGSQCSRVLAELLLHSVDQQLTQAGITWCRYVDDYVLVASNQADAYRGLASLAHALADYGLTLNKTKTAFLSAKHFVDYVNTQLGVGDNDVQKLKAIDLHFDPYSDNKETDYDDLKAVVDGLDIRALLDLEIQKAQPDTFLVAQIGRTLKYQEPSVALALCETLLSASNLHSFRASWATIMRGIAQLRSDDTFRPIFLGLDALLDSVPDRVSHLLVAEASCLHFLRTLRFTRTERRAQYVYGVYSTTKSQLVKRACIECWRHWKDRASFTRERNRWNALEIEVQRALWLSATEFGDEGMKFRAQVEKSLDSHWALGIETQGKASFPSLFRAWTPA